MKALMIVSGMFLVLSAAVYADDVKVDHVNAPKGTVSVVPVTGRLADVKSNCPEGARCFVALFTANIELELGSCVNELGPVQTSVVTENSRTVIYVSGMEFVNSAARTARCFRQETRQISVSPLTSPDVEVRFVGARD